MWLRGRLKDGAVQIKRAVDFKGGVQAVFVDPWRNAWYVDQDGGADANSGKDPDKAKLLLSAAEAAMAARDIIYLRAGSTDFNIPAAIDFDLNDIQVIGLSPTRFQPHVELGMPATTTFNPMLTFSGRGQYIANLTIKHGSQLSGQTGYATDLTCALISGRYNTFENVYFYGPLYPEQDVAATYIGVNVTGHNNYFYQCKFGSDGLDRDKANYNLQVAGVGNIFERCIFQMKNDGTAPFFVNISNVTRDMKYVLFKDCTFYAHDENFTQAVAYAFDTDAAGGNTVGVILDNCNFVNVTQTSDTTKDAVIWKIVTSKDNGTNNATLSQIALRNQGV